MNEAVNSYLQSAGLKIVTTTGEVKKLSAEQLQTRLSPVNLRVLQVLLKQAGEVVSRQQLFDQVWPNQTVSDDALTRSVSDLRSQLKTLTDVYPLIDTIPKVGYRWVPEVSSAPNTRATENSKPDNASIWAKHFKPLLLALVILTVMTWGLVYWLKSDHNRTAVAILPTQVVAANADQPVPDITAWLRSASSQHDSIRFLSTYAMKSFNGNPFPYYNQQFGVRWFIESELNQDRKQLVLNLVDAKTALVIHSKNYPYHKPIELQQHCQNFMAFLAGL